MLLNQYKLIQTVACIMINCLALKLLFIDKQYKSCASDNMVQEAPPPAALEAWELISLVPGHPQGC